MVWFKSSTKGRLDAVTLREVYKRFPLVAIALVLTAVSTLIELIDMI
jgi:hypothetical protein